jgi:alpha 1,3-mannosyltransferase
VGFVLDNISLKEANFGTRGLLAQKLYNMIHETENSWWAMLFKMVSKEREAEELVMSIFPFVQHPSNRSDTAPLRSLRSTFTPGSRGIVIPTGRNDARFAGYLILSLRDIHKITLPIMIAYAGDQDLPLPQRQKLKELRPGVEFLDVTAVLSDTFMGLHNGSWAVKPFAALASRFEQVILVDADAVFVRSPEILFDEPGYREMGY